MHNLGLKDAWKETVIQTDVLFLNTDLIFYTVLVHDSDIDIDLDLLSKSSVVIQAIIIAFVLAKLHHHLMRLRVHFNVY